MRQVAGAGDSPILAGARLSGPGVFSGRTAMCILASAACYYLATRIAWMLTFPDSKVSLFFPPPAVLVAILLLVPTRHWWAYTLAAACSHFFATQQEHWPVLYALHVEVFDAAKNLLAAAAVRYFIRSPVHRVSLRDAVVFVLAAVIAVPAATALWGAAFTVSNGFGTRYWVEWSNLAISNGVTVIVLVPAILMGAHKLATKGFKAERRRVLEACLLAVCLLTVGHLVFHGVLAGPGTSPALLYAPVPLLIWAALRFGLGGISACMLLVTVQAIWGTMQGHGPFLEQAPAENAMALQLFILMMASPLMLLAVAIEEERRSAAALRVSEERMNLAAESAQLALWDWDMANDEIWTTAEGRKIFGFEADEPLHFASMNGRVHPDDSAKRAATIRKAVETSAPYEAEFRIVLPGGSVRWIAARGRPSPASKDTPARFLGVSTDITRQKNAAAEARLQREELAHLSRVATVSALSGSLAHELSQPLASVRFNAMAGRRMASHEVPDLAEIRAIFEDIDSAGCRAVEIIDRLRTMLRRGEVTLRPVNVNESIEELLHLGRSDLAARGVWVSNLVAAGLPPAMTDRVQLQQVLLNLIVNACDAMQSNAAGDRKLMLTSSVTPNELHIGVLDCGVGLPDDVEALFQPFRTTKPGGLGMGLSICRMLVVSHGGRLWAERRAGRGAAFHVALPLANP